MKGEVILLLSKKGEQHSLGRGVKGHGGCQYHIDRKGVLGLPLSQQTQVVPAASNTKLKTNQFSPASGLAALTRYRQC